MTQTAKVLNMKGGEIVNILVAQVYEPPFLPRKTFAHESLVELGKTYHKDGLLTPIMVSCMEDGRYELHFGSRRLRAAKAAGYTHIPAVITDQNNPIEIVTNALIENVQREDFEPLEEANAYLWLHQEHNLNVREIAQNVSKSDSYVRKRLKLLDVAREVQQLVADDKISATTAALLAQIHEGETQVTLAEEAVRDRLSTDEVRFRIRESESGNVGNHNIQNRPMSVRKYRLKLVSWQKKMKDAFAVVENLPMTSAERGELMVLQLELEKTSEQIRNRLSALGKIEGLPSRKRRRSSNIPSASNHRQEWPTQHLALLEDSSLSDEIVAERTGRTAIAVKSMRSLVKKKSTLRKK